MGNAYLSQNGKTGLLKIKNKEFIWGKQTYIMGIINITPDSFSNDGLLDVSGGAGSERLIEAVLEQARRFEEEGADLLDVGGESTRPNAAPVSEEEELRRVIPVVYALSRATALPVSVDTYKARVAREAIRAGADIINDVWGGRKDPGIFDAAVDSNSPVIIMHNQTGTDYYDLLGDITRDLCKNIDMAVIKGVDPNRIIIDPGIGFGKTREQNIEVLRRLKELKTLGFPVLLGVSRKSMIGLTLNLPVEERLEGTAAAVCIGIINGADIVRVHDVKAMHRVARMTDAVVRG